jgi:hypothetical protein
MDYKNLVAIIINFFNLIYDICKTLISGILMHIKNLINTLFFFKKFLVVILILYIIYICAKNVWRNKEHLSRFLWVPEPIVSGFILDFFGQFYQNHLTEGLLALQNLLNTLPNSTPIIIILGEEDNFENIVTAYKNKNLSWFFIRNNIYIYIKNSQDAKFTISFLNKIKNIQPINSVVLKTTLTEGVTEDILKIIAMTSGIKAPLYLVFHNEHWCNYMWEYFNKNTILGFLLENNNIISSLTLDNTLNNLRLYIWENILKTGHYSFEFWHDYENMKPRLLEILIFVYNLHYNYFRGIFFTSNEYKVHLEHLLEVPQEKNNYFTTFYKEIVEAEVFLATPFFEENIFISRYTKYKTNFFICCMFFLSAYILNTYINIWNFNKTYTEYLLQTKNLLSQKGSLQKHKNNSYTIYELMNKINNINLSNIHYKYLPHIYLVNNLYETLCSIEELLIFFVLNLPPEDINVNQLEGNKENVIESFNKFKNYTLKILEIEKNIFTNEETKRFGIYKTRNEINSKNAKLFFEQSFEDIRLRYTELLHIFIEHYCDATMLEDINIFQLNLEVFFKNNDIQIDNLQNLIKDYYKLQNSLKLKNSKLQLDFLLLLFARLEKSIIFGPNIILESQNIIHTALTDYYLNIISIKNNTIGNILIMQNNNLYICDKLTKIITDLENFLEEPFMENIRNSCIQIPIGNMITNWNIPVLKDILNLRNQAPSFKEKLNHYSTELQIIFFNIFQKKLSQTIFNKIGIAQTINSLDNINLQNTIEAFTILNILLDFFFLTGNMDYYNYLIDVIIHDIKLINNIVEEKLQNTIFYSYARMYNLKRDNIQEFICNTNKLNKIKNILNTETDNLFQIYTTYMEPIIKILESDHFISYRGSQYMQYCNIKEEFKKYNKGFDNALQRFQKFISSLQTYSIYDSFNFTFDISEEDSYLDDLLTQLKEEIIKISQKLYREELLLLYDNLRQSFKGFFIKYPFNKNYEADNCVNTDDLYILLKKNEKIIDIFDKNNILSNEIKISIQQIKSLSENIRKDTYGYYFQGKVIYNIHDSKSQHNKYIGLVNINQTKEYAHFLLQEEIKLYMHQPVYLHIEISHHKDLRISHHIHKNFFHVQINPQGVTLIFENFWSFMHYIFIHEEIRTKEDITMIVNIPVEYNHIPTNIRFSINIKNFLFFPNNLPPLNKK